MVKININIKIRNKVLSSIEILKLFFDVSENETRIGQHFTFSDKLHIFPAQQDNIWQGNNIPYALSKGNKPQNFYLGYLLFCVKTPSV